MLFTHFCSLTYRDCHLIVSENKEKIEDSDKKSKNAYLLRWSAQRMNATTHARHKIEICIPPSIVCTTHGRHNACMRVTTNALLKYTNA